MASTAAASLAGHTRRTDNPHAVTKAQVGVGNVDNTSDASNHWALLPRTRGLRKLTLRTWRGPP